jgi:hypothetical protein
MLWPAVASRQLTGSESECCHEPLAIQHASQCRIHRPNKTWSYFIVVVSFCFFCAYLFQLHNYPLLPANHIENEVKMK